MAASSVLSTMKPARILSIQSHVVSGYVGNKCAVFTLQVLGFEVDPLNSVQFSNHTGYAGGIRGRVLDSEQLGELVEGLIANGLADDYTHVITGYIGDESFLLKIAEVIEILKTRNRGLQYVCDPVMGDRGPGLYVPKQLVPLYRDRIVPLADICLPNQFELELLTGVSVKTEDDAVKAIKILHQVTGVKIISLSSMELESGSLIVMGSSSTSTTKKSIIEHIPVQFVGSGDLYTALFTAWLWKTEGNLEESMKRVLATMRAVLRRTYESTKGGPVTPAKLELKLIQSKVDIENPDTSNIMITDTP